MDNLEIQQFEATAATYYDSDESGTYSLVCTDASDHCVVFDGFMNEDDNVQLTVSIPSDVILKLAEQIKTQPQGVFTEK